MAVRAETGGTQASSGRYRVGVDVGGTFVDIVAVSDSGQVHVTKVPTEPRIFSAVKEGLDHLQVTLDAVTALVHGSTVATNALVQKTGARTLLVTTKGFRDILEIRRTDKGDLFNLNWSPPRPIIERANRLEIDERVTWTGEVIRPLDVADVERLIRIIEKRDIEAVAVIFLHAYINPSHEQQLRDLLLERRPHLHVSTSSEVVPSYREFERTATTAANAYIAPIVARYVERFVQDLQCAGFSHDVLIMQSNGGVSSFEGCKEVPAKTIRSGPAGGAIALAAAARQSGFPNMIGLDIGGTTADVSMVWEYEVKWRPYLTVEFGLPILFPALDIVSIGAGGGTIASIDKGGALRVGPESAGADPGPACYGLGGQQPTSTDAQVVLGRLSPTNFLGGRMQVHPELSTRSITERISRPLGLPLDQAALGIIEVMNNNMIQAVRLVTIERGYDPRDFVLCAFGGGGPLYAADIARALNIPTVVVPPRPGVFSAYGVLQADVVHDVSRTLLATVAELDFDTVESHFQDLEAKVLDLFEREEIPSTSVVSERYADLLYTGQTHTIPILISRQSRYTPDVRNQMIENFHTEHGRRFGHSDPQLPVEFVNLRVFGKYALPREQKAAHARGTESDSNGPSLMAVKETRSVFFVESNGFVDTPIYGRQSLFVGSKIKGPAIIEQMDTTTVIPPGTTASVDAQTGNIVIRF